MEHELKTDPEHFEAIIRGDKTFELRRNDRGFEAGDTLRLRETRHSAYATKNMGAPLAYTGREILVRVTHMLHGCEVGLDVSYCIMSIKPVAELRAQARIRDLEFVLREWLDGSSTPTKLRQQIEALLEADNAR